MIACEPEIAWVGVVRNCERLARNYHLAHVVLRQEEMEALEGTKKFLDLAIGIRVEDGVVARPLDVDLIRVGKMVAAKVCFDGRCCSRGR